MEKNLYDEKKHNLLKSIDEYTKKDCVVAFSGGVDSTLVLKLACESAKKNGTKVYAVIVNTKLHPTGDLDEAFKIARGIGAACKTLNLDELKEASIENNPIDRCYLCKKSIFNKIICFSKDKSCGYVLDGTNEDDMHVYRPGIKALKELNVISPLADSLITKNEVREWLKDLHINISTKPSAPCLATRLPYNTKLDYELLGRIDEGEKYLRKLGFYNVRIRIHNDIARIEVDDKDIDKILNCRELIVRKLKDLQFEYITIDLQGFRSGSMDEKL